MGFFCLQFHSILCPFSPFPASKKHSLAIFESQSSRRFVSCEKGGKKGAEKGTEKGNANWDKKGTETGAKQPKHKKRKNGAKKGAKRQRKKGAKKANKAGNLLRKTRVVTDKEKNPFPK